MNEQTASSVDCTKWYRTELPNMADDELDPFQYRLYAHYKRVCGGSNGTCFESVRTTAEKTKMSAEKVISTRQWLAENGWIKCDEMAKGTFKVAVADKWEENLGRYSSRSTVRNSEQIDALPLEIPNGICEKTDEPLEIPNTTVRNSEHKKELYKKEHTVVADATQRTDSPSDVEAKNKHGRKTAKRKVNVDATPIDETPKPPTEHQLMFEKICQIVGWDWKTIGEKEKGQVAQTLGILKKAEYTLDELNRFGKEVWIKDWRWVKHKQYPTLTLLRSEIGKLRQTEQQKEEMRTPTDGVSWRKVFEEQKQKFAEYEW